MSEDNGISAGDRRAGGSIMDCQVGGRCQGPGWDVGRDWKRKGEAVGEGYKEEGEGGREKAMRLCLSVLGSSGDDEE